MPLQRPIIALDADGVLLDYNTGYRHAWNRAFGELPELKDPDAYWAMDRWEVRRVEGDERERLRECFDEYFWSNLPALDGALNACQRLHAFGFELICVSALGPEFREARLTNLQALGFPIEHVFATSNRASSESPKAATLRELRPVAFVDDYLPYLRGIPTEIHSALIMREPNGSPNVGEELALAHSRHVNLSEFANWWCEHGWEQVGRTS